MCLLDGMFGRKNEQYRHQGQNVVTEISEDNGVRLDERCAGCVPLSYYSWASCTRLIVAAN